MDAAQTVRQTAPDRYFASLYAPRPARDHLMILYAFDAEVGAVRDKVSTPMLGEVRLQWWRDALEAGEGRGNPLAHALIDVMARRDLPKQALLDLLEARVFDLYDDPFPTMNDLEGHAGETRGRVLALASAILAPDLPQTGPAADAAGHGAVALALRDALFGLRGNAAAGQTFLPAETLMRHSLTNADIAAGEKAEAQGALAEEIRDAAAGHLAAFALAANTLPPAARPAYLPVALARLDLADVTGRDASPRPLWRRLWALRQAARRGF